MAIFLTIALVLTAFALHFKVIALGIGATAGWLLVGIYGFVLSEGLWDISYGLGWFGIGMAISTIILTIGIREKEEALTEEEQMDKDMDDSIEEQEEFANRQGRYRDLFRPKKSKKRRRQDRFERTGRV